MGFISDIPGSTPLSPRVISKKWVSYLKGDIGKLLKIVKQILKLERILKKPIKVKGLQVEVGLLKNKGRANGLC
jgi:hypothetical protein